MPELLSSKIIIQEEDPTIKSFPDLPTAVPGFQGIAERGPIASPQLLTSYEEYTDIFGGMINGRQLALAVRAFFLNGGTQCYVSRTVHFSNVDAGTVDTAAKGAVTLQTNLVGDGPAELTGTTNGPWSLAPGDTLVASVNGGGDETLTFDAAAASVTSTGGAPFTLSDGMTLTVKIDQGAVQTATFNTADFVDIGNATAAEVAAVLNQDLTGCSAEVATADVKITSDKKGTGSYVEVTGGTSNTEISFSTSEIQGTGDVADIKAVTYAEVAVLVAADWTGVTPTEVSSKLKLATTAVGGTETLQIQASSTADTVFGLDNDLHTGTATAVSDTLTMTGKYEGAYANNHKIKIAAATSGTASEFNLQVLTGSVINESFANLTMDSTAERYAVTIINDADVGSLLFVASDESAPGTVTDKRPADVSGATVTSGNDGLTDLDVNDFIGSEAGAVGNFAFDLTDDITILVSPDETSTGMHNAMIQYCETTRKGLVFPVLDPPVNQTKTQMVTHVETLSASEFGALYWPRVKIINPSSAIFGTATDITVVPSGLICGRMATNDREEDSGPFFQPAGTEAGKPYGIVGLEREEVKLESVRDIVYPKRINPITYMRGSGYFIDGSRTLLGTGNFPSIGERRGVSHIEKLLERGLQWVRHRNHTPRLRREVYKAVYAELYDWMKAGAFASGTPATAFFVDVGTGLNTASVIRAGKLIIRVGLATNTPAEFVIIKVTKDTRALNEELFGS